VEEYFVGFNAEGGRENLMCCRGSGGGGGRSTGAFGVLHALTPKQCSHVLKVWW